MLGRFLEVSIATPDIQASLNFYGKLGFSQAEVGDAWNHPYAVVTDGRLCVGLHQDSQFTSSLTFVKPDLLKHLPVLEALDVTLAFRRLGSDVFNEIGWHEPSGHLVRLVEARTFSPPKRAASERSSCGYFVQLALPTVARETAKAYWERFGFVGMDEPGNALPHLSCTSDTLEIGLHENATVRQATLLFEVDDFAAALSSLEALEVPLTKRDGNTTHGLSLLRLTAPEGTPIVLMAASLG